MRKYTRIILLIVTVIASVTVTQSAQKNRNEIRNPARETPLEGQMAVLLQQKAQLRAQLYNLFPPPEDAGVQSCIEEIKENLRDDVKLGDAWRRMRTTRGGMSFAIEQNQEDSQKYKSYQAVEIFERGIEGNVTILAEQMDEQLPDTETVSKEKDEIIKHMAMIAIQRQQNKEAIQDAQQILNDLVSGARPGFSELSEAINKIDCEIGQVQAALRRPDRDPLHRTMLVIIKTIRQVAGLITAMYFHGGVSLDKTEQKLSGLTEKVNDIYNPLEGELANIAAP